jgi:hypothetical protein
MTQQINLLRAPVRKLGTLVWTTAGFAVLLLGLPIYHQTLVRDNARLRASAQEGERTLAQLKATQKQQTSEVDAAALTAEIATLKPRVAAVTQLVTALRSGSLGNPTGFARYFNALGGIPQDGLWLTSVAVAKGGSSLSVGGRAIRSESVMQYARRLNEVFTPFGVHFDSLELTPEIIQKPGAAAPGAAAPTGPAMPTSIVFKLS